MSEEQEEEVQDVPTVTVHEAVEWMQSQPDLVLLDVREPYEFPRARLNDPRVVHAPLSELARKNMQALPEAARDQDATIVVFCHHGFRSAQVVAWLQAMGWSSVYNLSGGIDAYARQIDPEIGLY